MVSQSDLTRLKSLLSSKKDVAEKCVLLTQMAAKLSPTDAVSDALDAALPKADPLLKVAIMDAWFEIADDRYYEEELEKMLEKAGTMHDRGEQLYMAARVALGRINGLSMDSLDETGDGQLEITATAQRRAAARRRGAPKIIDEITIIIHGTWAADGSWWRPKGDFFEYVKTDLGRSDLYDKADQFKWSGKNRESSRRKAGVALDKWLRSHPAAEVNVFGHSHGANVAMLATHQGIYMNRLIMLSPPVRRDYFANWKNVGQAYNIQASFDPVVAIARGGQWFNDVRKVPVLEKKMKASGHSASHDPEVWRSEKLAKFIGIPPAKP